jgi:hypothetical protein
MVSFHIRTTVWNLQALGYLPIINSLQCVSGDMKRLGLKEKDTKDRVHWRGLFMTGWPTWAWIVESTSLTRLNRRKAGYDDDFFGGGLSKLNDNPLPRLRRWPMCGVMITTLSSSVLARIRVLGLQSDGLVEASWPGWCPRKQYVLHAALSTSNLWTNIQQGQSNMSTSHLEA